MNSYGVINLDELVKKDPISLPDKIARAAAMIRILDLEQHGLFYSAVQRIFCSDAYSKVIREDSNCAPYFIDGISFGFLTNNNASAFVDLIDDDMSYWLGKKACWEFGDEKLINNEVYATYDKKIKLASDFVKLWKPLLKSFCKEENPDKATFASYVQAELIRNIGVSSQYNASEILQAAGRIAGLDSCAEAIIAGVPYEDIEATIPSMYSLSQMRCF
jgi:hypothetical protein